jgi:toxin HigB-1
MILSFGDKRTQDIFDGINSPAARKFPINLHGIASRKLDMINAAHILGDLRTPPGNRLEALKGSLKGKHSIRINNQWRIVFRWSDADRGAHEVLIEDYH